MKMKEEYIAPQSKTVYLRFEGVICQSLLNQTEPLNEDIFTW